MSEWRSCALGELIDAADGEIRTGPFGSQLHAAEYTDDPSGIPVVMPKDMLDGRISHDSISLVSEATAKRLHVHRLAAGDLVLARRGDIGRLSYVAQDEAGWLCGTGSMRIHAPNHDALNPLFLRYAMSSPNVVEWLKGQAVGATMPNLNAQIVGAVPIAVPGTVTQHRVAAILSAFDELIEINERRIALLEDLARSLYREWFVHFRFPGNESVGFIDSEHGRIPKGWRVCRIEDVAANLTRGIAPNYADNGSWAVINQRCIRNQRVIMSPARRHKGNVSEVKHLRGGDVLINSTGVGTLGRVAVLPEVQDTLTADSHVTIVRPASQQLHPWFGLNMLNREVAFQAMGTGSTGQTELGRAAVGALPITVPAYPVLDEFQKSAQPLLKPMSTLMRHVVLLSRTRDLLLPRLVTGRLDISDVDLGVLTPSEID